MKFLTKDAPEIFDALCLPDLTSDAEISASLLK